MLWSRNVRTNYKLYFTFNIINSVQTGSGAHAASYPKGTGAIFPRVKRSRREVDHSPPLHLVPRSKMVEL
jgi:hypothetical protein